MKSCTFTFVGTTAVIRFRWVGPARLILAAATAPGATYRVLLTILRLHPTRWIRPIHVSVCISFYLLYFRLFHSICHHISFIVFFIATFFSIKIPIYNSLYFLCIYLLSSVDIIYLVIPFYLGRGGLCGRRRRVGWEVNSVLTHPWFNSNSLFFNFSSIVLVLSHLVWLHFLPSPDNWSWIKICFSTFLFFSFFGFELFEFHLIGNQITPQPPPPQN